MAAEDPRTWLRLGQVVSSRGGRDRGRYYLVIGFTGNMVEVADGVVRRVENPKKKNPKHLQPHNLVADEIGRKLRAGQMPANAELRQWLRLLIATMGGAGSGGSVSQEADV